MVKSVKNNGRSMKFVIRAWLLWWRERRRELIVARWIHCKLLNSPEGVHDSLSWCITLMEPGFRLFPPRYLCYPLSLRARCQILIIIRKLMVFSILNMTETWWKVWQYDTNDTVSKLMCLKIRNDATFIILYNRSEHLNIMKR